MNVFEESSDELDAGLGVFAPTLAIALVLNQRIQSPRGREDIPSGAR